MVSVNKTITVSCLDCEQLFEIGFRPIEGQIINCPHCDAELEVISTQPFEFDFYFEDLDEEWDEDEDWEEEDDWSEEEEEED